MTVIKKYSSENCAKYIRKNTNSLLWIQLFAAIGSGTQSLEYKSICNTIVFLFDFLHFLSWDTAQCILIDVHQRSNRFAASVFVGFGGHSTTF